LGQPAPEEVFVSTPQVVRAAIVALLAGWAILRVLALIPVAGATGCAPGESRSASHEPPGTSRLTAAHTTRRT
jgi:hypothetical protein